MEELIEKIDNLKKAISEIDRVKEYISKKQEIMKNKELLKEIEEYQINNKESLKKHIISNQEYRDYKKIETDINFIILEINQQLKKIQNKGWCDK